MLWWWVLANWFPEMKLQSCRNIDCLPLPLYSMKCCIYNALNDALYTFLRLAQNLCVIQASTCRRPPGSFMSVPEPLWFGCPYKLECRENHEEGPILLDGEELYRSTIDCTKSFEYTCRPSQRVQGGNSAMFIFETSKDWSQDKVNRNKTGWGLQNEAEWWIWRNHQSLDRLPHK